MIRIEATGLRATVQDRGRFGHLREGVPPSGPADPIAFAAAQALVGNDFDAAAIEIVGDAFAFRCEDRRIVAVTGRDVALRGRGLVPGWTAAFARPGETFTVASWPTCSTGRGSRGSRQWLGAPSDRECPSSLPTGDDSGGAGSGDDGMAALPCSKPPWPNG